MIDVNIISLQDTIRSHS